MSTGINSDAHVGLRGVAAVWIMIFHAFIYSDAAIDLQGSSLMPLFFLFSGFSLTLSYKPSEGSNSFMSTSNIAFYQNRLARTYPVYLLWTLLSIPLWIYGYGSGPPSGLIPSLIVSLLLIATGVFFIFGGALDGPGWTICTLFIMWLFFPISVSQLRSLSDAQIINQIIVCYWLQLALIIILFLPLLVLVGFEAAFFMSTCNPWTRYPVFHMGIYAAELCLRAKDRPLKWPSIFLCFFPTSCCCQLDYFTAERNEEAEKRFWTKTADWNSAFLLLFTLSVTIGDAIYRYVPAQSLHTIFGGLWLQAIVPLAQLTVIVALVRDGGQSHASKLLLQPTLQWLGRISMSIYLIHFPIIYYLMWANNDGNYVEWPNNYSCDATSANRDDDYSNCRDNLSTFYSRLTLPYWLIPVVVVLTIPLSAATFYLVEEPCRKAFRRSESPQQQHMRSRQAQSRSLEGDKQSMLADGDEELSVLNNMHEGK